MEELLENLLFSALFPEIDGWRRANRLDLPDPSDDALRAFVRVEMRLQLRYGFAELEEMVSVLRFRRTLQGVSAKLAILPAFALWPLLIGASAWRAPFTPSTQPN